jgi:hypothetical protein
MQAEWTLRGARSSDGFAGCRTGRTLAAVCAVERHQPALQQPRLPQLVVQAQGPGCAHVHEAAVSVGQLLGWPRVWQGEGVASTVNRQTQKLQVDEWWVSGGAGLAARRLSAADL